MLREVEDSAEELQKGQSKWCVVYKVSRTGVWCVCVEMLGVYEAGAQIKGSVRMELMCKNH